MRIVGENMFTEAWKQVPPSLPALRSSALCFRVKGFWIESSLTSGAELSSPRTNLLYPVPGGCVGWAAVLLRYACEEALETSQLQAPDPLQYNGSFGA